MSTLYLVLSFWGSLISTSMSLIIRKELSNSINSYCIEEVTFNVLVTSHSLVMIFFFLMPALISSLGNWLIPLYMGVPDMAFPRMNNLSFWLLYPSLMFVVFSTMVSEGFGGGWTVYPPLSSWLSTSNASVDFLIFSLHLASASSIMSGINFISTILMFGGKSYEYNMIPLYIWAMFVTVFLLVMSLPVLAAGVTMLLFDRNLGTNFFDSSSGSDPIFFQHLFWFFSHPEVYVLILPGFSLMSNLIYFYTNSEEFFSYYSMMWAIGAISFLGSIVWAHHMYTIGMDMDTRSYFTAASLVISVPTSVKVFTWFSMMGSNNLELSSVGMWVYSFIFLFIFGGLTGIILANASVDLILHDTYFVVAHFHYVLSMSAIFSLFGGMYHWYPMFLGAKVNLEVSNIHFCVLLVSVNMLFFPMHMLGVSSMPRRYVSYNDELDYLNEVCNLSMSIACFSMMMPMVIVMESMSNMEMGMHNMEDSNLLDMPHSYSIPSHTYIESPIII